MFKTKGFLVQFTTGYFMGLIVLTFMFIFKAHEELTSNEIIKQFLYCAVVLPIYFFSIVVPSQALINIEGLNIDNVKTYPIEFY